MTDPVSGLGSVVPTQNSDDRMVTMSQRAFDAVMGENKREAREKALRDQESLIEERAATKAAEIAERKAEEVVTRREAERKQKADEEELNRQKAKVKESGDRLTEKFIAAAKKHSDFNDLAGQYNWNDQRNQQILPHLDDEEIDNAGDVLHHLMKEDGLDKLSLRSPEAIKKKVKEISAILKKNEEIKADKNSDAPPEPIARTRPSHIPNKGDGGPMKVGQFKGRLYRN